MHKIISSIISAIFLTSNPVYPLPANSYNSLRIPLGSISPDRARTVEKSARGIAGMKVGMNGTAGLTGPHVLKRLISAGAIVTASCFHEIPNALKDQGLKDLNIRNILIPQDAKDDLRDVDAFLHIAGRPVQYADSNMAPNIFAVVAIGSALVALAAHDENEKRNKEEKHPLRMIMFSSISSVWMDDYISMLERNSETKKQEKS